LVVLQTAYPQLTWPPQCSKLSSIDVFHEVRKEVVVWGGQIRWGTALSWRNNIPFESFCDVWRQVAASVCWEEQRSTLPWWLHPFPGSL
jgi:hypothetical protein